MIKVLRASVLMVGQKSKKRKEDISDLSSVHDLISNVGSTRSRIAHEAELEGKSEGAKSFIQHVGHVSDRINDSKRRKMLSLAGAAAAAYMAISPAAFAGQSVNEPGYSRQEIAVLTKFIKNDSKYAARGEEITKAASTNEVVGIVDINRLKGYSSEMFNGGRVVKGASVQLNTYVHLVSGSGKNQWLWVQDGVQIFIHSNKKHEVPTYTYGSISEVFKDSLKFDAQAIEGKAPTQKEFNSLKLNGLAGKGNATKSFGVLPTYVYSDYNPSKENGKWTISGGDVQTSKAIRFALDIRVAERQDLVYLNFGIAPLKNGRPDWGKEVVFDIVSYRVQGLKSANIEFNKLRDTGLLVTGIGGGSYFHAKEISGTLSMAEKRQGILVPLAVNGTTDWSTGEHTLGVRSVRLSSSTVELVTTGKNKNAKN